MAGEFQHPETSGAADNVDHRFVDRRNAQLDKEFGPAAEPLPLVGLEALREAYFGRLVKPEDDDTPSPDDPPPMAA